MTYILSNQKRIKLITPYFGDIEHEISSMIRREISTQNISIKKGNKIVKSETKKCIKALTKGKPSMGYHLLVVGGSHRC